MSEEDKAKSPASVIYECGVVIGEWYSKNFYFSIVVQWVFSSSMTLTGWNVWKFDRKWNVAEVASSTLFLSPPAMEYWKVINYSSFLSDWLSLHAAFSHFQWKSSICQKMFCSFAPSQPTAQSPHFSSSPRLQFPELPQLRLHFHGPKRIEVIEFWFLAKLMSVWVLNNWGSKNVQITKRKNAQVFRGRLMSK